MKCYVIAGETAVGKSKFGIALAKKFIEIGHSARIINGDSQQVISELPILSDQPQDLQGIPHELYGYKSINSDTSSFIWMVDVMKIIEQCKIRNEIPIVIGGSGFYLRNLVEGHWQLPKNCPVEETSEYMYKFIRDASIHANDKYRIARQFNLRDFDISKHETMFMECDFTTIQITSAYVEENIKNRIEAIFELAKDEVKQHIYNDALNKVIGFKEIKSYLLNQISEKEAKDLMRIRIRQYAKRQRTWFRNKMKFDFVVDKPEEFFSAIFY